MSILPEYEKLLFSARAKQKENKIFLHKLKKQNPTDLDIVTNDFHDEAFKKIDCLKCANCCSTSGPLFKNRDIDKLSAELKMRSSQFTDKYLHVDEEGDWVLNSLPCSFLGKDNYCTVYSARPNACREFPHTQMRNIVAKLPITFLNSMICPAVAQVVEDLKGHYIKKGPIYRTDQSSGKFSKSKN